MTVPDGIRIPIWSQASACQKTTMNIIDSNQKTNGTGSKEDDKWKIHLYLTMNYKEKNPSKSYRGAKAFEFKIHKYQEKEI